MSVIRTVAVHDVVRAVFPRPDSERDEVPRILGRVADAALAEFSHAAAQGRRPTAASCVREATRRLDEELADAHLTLGPDERTKLLAQVQALAQGFRRSELYGLARPRSRLLLVNGRVGVYAQPDYWDGRGRIYEMKTYGAYPPPADVELQLTLFQLAFPGFEQRLVCLDRHAVPLEVTVAVIPPPAPERAHEALRQAFAVGLSGGTEKVFEYIDHPVTRYEVGGPDPAA